MAFIYIYICTKLIGFHVLFSLFSPEPSACGRVFGCTMCFVRSRLNYAYESNSVSISSCGRIISTNFMGTIKYGSYIFLVQTQQLRKIPYSVYRYSRCFHWRQPPFADIFTIDENSETLYEILIFPLAKKCPNRIIYCSMKMQNGVCNLNKLNCY